MVEFFMRLVSTMEHGGGYMYRHKAHVGQLIGMAVLAILCYQFTVIGDTLYTEAMRNLLHTASALGDTPIARMADTSAIKSLAKGVPDMWDVSCWLVVLLKAAFMSLLIGAYAIVQRRKYYPTTMMTGVLHIVAYGHLFIGVCLLSLGLMMATVKVPMVLTILLGIFLMIVCTLLAVSLLNVTGRVIGACVGGTSFEGLIVMVGSYMIWTGVKTIVVLAT